jgi:two-component system response regulator FixJ
MPGLSGLDLQRELSARGLRSPLILITGYGDITTAVAAVKAGAHDFLEKPFDEERLKDSIRAAVTEVGQTQAADEYLAEIRERVGGLSERQREVMTLAAQGFTNKEIGKKMDITTRTVESYRSWVMERTGAKNLAELIRMAMRLGMVS